MTTKRGPEKFAMRFDEIPAKDYGLEMPTVGIGGLCEESSACL